MKRLPCTLLNLVAFLSLGVGSVLAKDATFKCADATKAGKVHISIDAPPSAKVTIDIPISGPMSAADKRDVILRWFADHGPQYNVAPAGTDSFVMKGFQKTTTLTFSPGDTGEGADQIASIGTPQGEVAFADVFDPFDAQHLPAVFTAGIVTDVGVLSAQVSAQQLNFQTDGPIICQALFQRLAPRAPRYGAQINYAGDRLEVYFDPAYTVTQSGVIFGTTSPSNGCAGSLLVLPEPDTTPPTLLSAVSRKTHGGAGDFDIDLPLDPSTTPATECRLGGPTMLVLNFSEDIVALDGVPDGTEVHLSEGILGPVSISGTTMTVRLSGVPDVSCLEVDLSGLADLAGNPLGGISDVRVGVLAGDTNNDQQVGSADISQTKGRNGHLADPTNFRSDVNIDGQIGSADVSAVKGKNGHAVACSHACTVELHKDELTVDGPATLTLGETKEYCVGTENGLSLGCGTCSFWGTDGVLDREECSPEICYRWFQSVAATGNGLIDITQDKDCTKNRCVQVKATREGPVSVQVEITVTCTSNHTGCKNSAHDARAATGSITVNPKP